MPITSLSTEIIELPLPRPIDTAIHQMRSVGCVLVTIETNDGIQGEGFAFTLNADRIRAFDEMIRGFAPYVIGREVFDSEAIWHDIWEAINPTGHKGVTIGALSAIDTACWDAAGRSADLPLAKMFGRCRETVPTYASSGLWLSASLDDLVAEAVAFVDTGFRAVKMRIGGTDDISRVRAVSDAVGPEIGLLVDANQAFTAKEAIRLGRQLEEFNLVWIEEPVPPYALTAHAEVRTALDTPIASGETEYSRFGMQAMIEARSVDILMPDLQRVGGYSEMRKVAGAAAAQQVPISTHFFTEYSLAFAGATAGCGLVEHVDWFAPLFNESMELVDGELVVPDRPGTGFTFRSDLTELFPFQQ